MKPINGRVFSYKTYIVSNHAPIFNLISIIIVCRNYFLFSDGFFHNFLARKIKRAVYGHAKPHVSSFCAVCTGPFGFMQVFHPLAYGFLIKEFIFILSDSWWTQNVLWYGLASWDYKGFSIHLPYQELVKQKFNLMFKSVYAVLLRKENPKRKRERE